MEFYYTTKDSRKVTGEVTGILGITAAIADEEAINEIVITFSHGEFNYISKLAIYDDDAPMPCFGEDCDCTNCHS